MNVNHAVESCAAMVRVGDPDRYLTAIFAPPRVRHRLMALYAFNLELARVAEVVSEPMIGEIRLQWWREAIDGIYAGAPRQHDVTLALAGVIAETGLPRAPFDRMIDARVFDLEDAPFESVAAVTGYLDNTGGALMGQAIRALLPNLDGTDSNALDRIAVAGGVAFGLMGLVRAVGYHAAQGRSMLPRDAMAGGELAPDALIGGELTPPVAALVARMADETERALGQFDEEVRLLPRAAVPACLPVVLARNDLRLVRRLGHDPFRLQAHPGLMRLVRVSVCGITKRL
ncbi:MAG: phytoene/squalene synthase family protein [Sphingomonadales bacterium]